ncbi:hypothetical protein BLOT_000854 [Blomia tropicalis]|nr:hypothetical protein BLOT_000854 [Blomia tropicalis]
MRLVFYTDRWSPCLCRRGASLVLVDTRMARHERRVIEYREQELNSMTNEQLIIDGSDCKQCKGHDCTWGYTTYDLRAACGLVDDTGRIDGGDLSGSN